MFKECDKYLLSKGHSGQKKDILATMEKQVILEITYYTRILQLIIINSSFILILHVRFSLITCQKAVCVNRSLYTVVRK